MQKRKHNKKTLTESVEELGAEIDDVSNSAATQEGTRQEDEARSINHELRQRQTELEARTGRNDETSVGRIQQEARVIDECKGRLATRPLQAGKGAFQ